MREITINGQKREATGKKASKMMRKEGLVPCNLYGEAKDENGLAQGVRDGGKLNLSIRKIDVTAPYKNIPEILEIDVTNLGLGKAIKVGELNFEGLKLATPAQVVVCSVKETRASKAAAAAAE